MPQPELMQMIESIRAEEASVRRIYGGDGLRLRDRRQTPAHMAKLAETVSFLSDVFDGRLPIHYLQEAMTTSDFPLMFGDILDRQVMAQYTEWAATWPNVARKGTVADFRDAKLFPPVFGADSRLTRVAEEAPYPAAKVDEQSPLVRKVHKYGRHIPFSWEAMVNDDLDQLKDMPARLARAARRTEEREVTDLYVDSSGPDATLYSTANLNKVTTAVNAAVGNNPILSISGLQQAMIVLASQLDETGEPIMVDSVTLVVPPALEIVAQNILSATELRNVAVGGVTGQEITVKNWMQNRVKLVVNPYLPIVATTNGHTAWYLFADPNRGRPALQLDFLRGYESPQILIKSPNALLPGGGMVDAMAGSFEDDSIHYRVRHVLGGIIVDPKATVASFGTALA